ncbi:hypothetical protein I4U23_025559 [Adineta vaga]|nr:hypothetical protein I4U23_025559 [Adineta vaga]
MNLMKELITNHPIFPLLTMVYQKCELATITPQPLDSLDDDIIEFIKQLNKEQFQYGGSNDEIDNFMIQAIQVLRFHLLEIDKVHELCDNFCQRYITLLKDKMSLDLFTDDCKSEEEEEGESLINDEDIKPIYSSPHQIQLNRSLSISEGTNENFESDTYEETEEKVKATHRLKKRGIFPKSATSLMRTWLFQHLSHPYPSEDEKKFLAQETNLNILQVNNWFINARRRIVQPMIDQSNRAATMGTEYYNYTTNNPYYTVDLNRISHGLQPNLFDDMATTSAYYSPSIHSNSSFSTTTTTVTDIQTALLSAQYEISSLSYHERENGT